MLLSVIIPTRNRAERLADLLDSLAAQEPVAFDWEVLVIDNASTDDTASVTRSKADMLPIEIRYIMEPNPGLHQGRHRGAREARGKYLGYLDDDMILAPSWVQGVSLLVEGKADAVVGRILPKWESDPPKWLLDLFEGGTCGYLSILDLGAGIIEVDPSLVFGCNCFLPRDMVFKLGGFHPDGMPPELIKYRGDGETGFFMKFKSKGLRSMYDPQAIAYHIVERQRLTIEYICNRSYSQGISDSFTAIRKSHNERLTGVPPEGIYAKAWRHAGDLKRAIASLASALGAGGKISRRLNKCYREGFRFHQKELRNDPDLLRWVLKEHYFSLEPSDEPHQ